MCALLCADSKISPQANGACVCAVDYVLMYAQKLDSCTRPTHCVGSEQLVQMCALGHFRIQSWGARAWFLRMRIQPSFAYATGFHTQIFHVPCLCANTQLETVFASPLPVSITSKP